MDIRKMMTLCGGCVPASHLCMTNTNTRSQPWFTTSSGSSLAEDGGICLADYSPNGDTLCALSDVTISSKESVHSLSYSTCSSSFSSEESFASSNEALADKISPCSMEVSIDSVSCLGDSDKLSSSSYSSNEAEAVTYSSSLAIDASKSSGRNQDSLQSFTESVCGGEGLADMDMSSSSSSEYVDSLDSLSESASLSLSNVDSLSPIAPTTTPIANELCTF